MSVILNQSGIAVIADMIFGHKMYMVHVKVGGVRETVFSAADRRLDVAGQEVFDKILQADVSMQLRMEQAALIGVIMRGEL